MPPERPRLTLPSSAAPGAESVLTSPAAALPTRDQLPAGYAAFFAEVAARVRAAQLKAAAAVNRELIALYGDLGREIVARQAREGSGTGVIARRLTRRAGAGQPTNTLRSPNDAHTIARRGGRLLHRR